MNEHSEKKLARFTTDRLDVPNEEGFAAGASSHTYLFFSFNNSGKKPYYKECFRAIIPIKDGSTPGQVANVLEDTVRALREGKGKLTREGLGLFEFEDDGSVSKEIG